ncbi:MAG: hypothetical protein ACXVQ7_10215 [Actinomycetota bacterium]
MTGFVDWGLVTFTIRFFVSSSGNAIMEADITGCPHGWIYWEIT